MGARTPPSVNVVRGDQGRDRSPSPGDAFIDPLSGETYRLSVVHFDEEDSPPDAATPVEYPERRGSSLEDAKLSELIKQRVRSRTSDRIRNLEVACADGRVVIRGQCATFYTKQLAQHAAMGVIEDETVVNEITVGLPR